MTVLSHKLGPLEEKLSTAQVSFLYIKCIWQTWVHIYSIFTVYLLLWHGIGKSCIFAAQSTGNQ